MSGGGGSASTPTLLDDNLKSKQFYRVLDLISEGEIYGPIDQEFLSSFLLNDSPVTDSSGNVSINGVSATWRPGAATQNAITGFDFIEATTIVNTDVEFDTPLVRTVTDENVTRVRVNLGVSQLTQSDEKGNQSNATVTMVIETRSGNEAFSTVDTVTITGKISGEYLEAHVINAPDTKPFDIRVRRITADSTSDLLVNGTVWNSYTEITDENLFYPFSAVVGSIIDHDQYTDTPTRTYLMRGIICNVPDNYDPETRTYTGIWTGGFKSAWTNNPAWIFRELVLNTRYGLAKTTGNVDTDDGSLFTLAQFCDQSVDDGFGGEEPRMTLNAYITEQTSARDILDDIAGMFRGLAIWDGLRFTVMIDTPTDPITSITNANVIDGTFSYAAMAIKDRYNAVVVSWTDPDNGWSAVKEYVSDDAQIDRYGYNETTLEAFGCTSRGQANRAGKWLIESCKSETRTVKFQMARDAISFIPGDIVEIADNNRAGTRLGGRILSHTGAIITVDANVSDLAGTGDSLSIMGNDGVYAKHDIRSIEGNIITLEAEPSFVQDGTVFAITTSTISLQFFRITGISEDDNNSTYSISAAQHNPNKQAIVDEGAVFTAPTDTLNGYRVPNVENLKIINTNSETVQVTATWTTATLTKKITFELKVYTSAGAVYKAYTTDLYTFDFYGLDAGSYTLGVRGVNDNGMKGTETQVSLVIGAPSAPSNVQWIPDIFAATIVPVMNVTATTDTSFEFWGGTETPSTDIGNVENEQQFLGRSSQWRLNGLQVDHTYYVYVRTKNSFGVSDFVQASGDTSDNIPGLEDAIDEGIRNSPAFDAINTNLADNAAAILQNALANNATVNRQFAQYGEVKAEILTVSTTVADQDSAIADLETQLTATVDDVQAIVDQKLTANIDDDGTATATFSLRVGVTREDVFYGAGMALGVAPDGNGAYESTIVFNATQFGIYSGDQPGDYQLAFSVLNGQTFINEAFIGDATITSAKIQDVIQSSGYGNGGGWRLSKNDNNLIFTDSNNVVRFKVGRL